MPSQAVLVCLLLGIDTLQTEINTDKECQSVRRSLWWQEMVIIKALDTPASNHCFASHSHAFILSESKFSFFVAFPTLVCSSMICGVLR